MVEGDWGAKERVDDVWVVVKLLVDHEGKDSHLGGTAVVQLDGELLVKGLLVPSRGGDLGRLDLLLAGSKANLDQTNEGDDLGNTSGRDGVEGGKTSLHGGEGKAVGDVARKADTSSGHQVAKDGEHGDAAVLGLDGAEAVEALLVGVGKEAKRIPESYCCCREEEEFKVGKSVGY